MLLLGGLQACTAIPNRGPTTMAHNQTMNSTEILTKEVETIVKKAEQAIERQDWSSANALLKQGLDAVGERYAVHNSIDDTGMKLLLADTEEQKGCLQTAAQIRQRILASRLLLLGR